MIDMFIETFLLLLSLSPLFPLFLCQCTLNIKKEGRSNRTRMQVMHVEPMSDKCLEDWN